MTGQATDNAAPVSETVQALFAQAESAPTYAEALPLVVEALTEQLLTCMKAAKVPKADQEIEALRTSGLHHLLAEALLRGRLTYQAADRHLNRMRDAIRARTASVQDLKNGILAFDEAAQRMSLVAGKGGFFQYPLHANHARDSLISFASSLHR